MKKDPKPLNLWKVRQIAIMCGVSRTTVTTWITSGLLPAVDFAPEGSKRHSYRVKTSDLEKFMELRRVNASVEMRLKIEDKLTDFFGNR